MLSKTVSRGIALILGILVGVPIWALSHFVVWGILCGVITFLIIDIIFSQTFPLKIKGILLGLYVLTMLLVCVLLLSA